VSLGELASRNALSVPADLRHAKGFPGRLIEVVLGAEAGSRSEPDFARLGIELKTLPVTSLGRPCESTFVCRVALAEMSDVEWSRSRVRKKLQRVLWVPVEGERRVPVASRRIGEPLLWSPDAEEEAGLRFDWEELAGLVGRGQVESITGHLGQFLQVRPKAAHSRVRARTTDGEGASFAALPRGFYLRPAFTQRILAKHYRLG
jgi:DNA mismatch repair protein MutH